MNPSFDHVDEDDDVPPARIIHMLRETDDKHVSGHNRLRLDVEAHDERLQRIDELLADHGSQLTAAAKRTTDIGQLRFTPAMVAAIVAVCASIVGGQFASTAPLKDEITAIRSMIAAQDELKKADTKLKDERDARTASDIRDIKAQQTLQDIKFNDLREKVLTAQRK